MPNKDYRLSTNRLLARLDNAIGKVEYLTDELKNQAAFQNKNGLEILEDITRLWNDLYARKNDLIDLLKNQVNEL